MNDLCHKETVSLNRASCGGSGMARPKLTGLYQYHLLEGSYSQSFPGRSPIADLFCFVFSLLNSEGRNQ